jgi:PE family
MMFVTAQPEMLAASASSLQAIGSTLAAQNAATATPMTGVVPAAADPVSALTAAQFAAMHQMFVSTLQTSAGSYAATEAANAAATR